ncbi:MAG: DNA polymerase ligase N-terminal domain-containing protein [Nitrososphaerales archaeon]
MQKIFEQPVSTQFDASMEKKNSAGPLCFVVQKHKATTLHYDFRLEIGGVMPSWSIPKGPTLDSAVRRLAIPTSDHSLEYREFEGVIPRGEYGAGPVMIWDQGTYNAEREISKGVREEVVDRIFGDQVMQKSLKEGNVKFRLYGNKLRGSFALVRTSDLGSVKESWLLIKHRDEYSGSGYNANDYDFSAKTNRSIAEIMNGSSSERRA